MANNKKVKVNGKEYKLQSPGYRWYLKTVEDNTPPGKPNPSQVQMIDDYLEHVVVDPKVTIEDFEDEEQKSGGFKALLELITECETFLTA
jgi:hypothetical protein